ncbi:hypothetical protein IAT38_001524 [Cryptococcus sp. DSM 104549]
MLRRIRVKLHPLPLPLRVRLTSSAAALARSSSHVENEAAESYGVPYGVAYGAGPSRIPYTPPGAPGASHLSSTPSPTGRPLNAESLRRHLSAIPITSYSTPAVFLNSVLNAVDPSRSYYPMGMMKRPGEINRVLASLSRLELHIVLHHLIRERRGEIATGLIREALRGCPRDGRPRLLRLRTLQLLYGKEDAFKPSVYMLLTEAPDLNPTLEAQASRKPKVRLQAMLDVLEMLQEVRTARPMELYGMVITHAIWGRLPDVAAKVYVGLVEEWVTEGRVAEGANPEDFYHGGGPPRDYDLAVGPPQEVEQRMEVSEMLKGWWTGVRTWRWPGEVLSPHDRLDLWHPHHLSLPDKMKNFPIPSPTSPPSIVPQPHTIWLNNIVDSLQLDPTRTSPAMFAASMRALAILANTVLSRTLPIVALGPLLNACNAAPHKPDVFPERVTQRPADEEAWAYTAFTQLHVTLMSLLWSPPISSRSMKMIEAAKHAEGRPAGEQAIEPEALPPPSAESPYMTPPLAWSSCLILLRYAFRALRAPSMLGQLSKYMRRAFGMGGRDPSAWNITLEGASRLRQNDIARKVEEKLFDGVFGEEGMEGARALRSREKSVGHQAEHAEKTPALSFPTALLESEPSLGPDPDDTSVVNLITHLTVTSQFQRLEKLIYILIPFLAYSRRNTPLDAPEGLPVGLNGRPLSTALTPKIYVGLIRGLEKAGKTGLAQRVGENALFMEGELAREYAQRDPPAELPMRQRLSIWFFTAMLQVWENEVHAGQRARRTGNVDGQCRSAWTVPYEFEGLPRHRAAGEMAWLVHEHVRERWSNQWMNRKGDARGVEKYFEVLVHALWDRWGLDQAVEGHSARWRTARDEKLPPRKKVVMEMVWVAEDMDAWGFSVPPVMKARLKEEKVGVEFGKLSYVKKGVVETDEREKLLWRLMGKEHEMTQRT